jgi:hypothetical protein
LYICTYISIKNEEAEMGVVELELGRNMGGAVLSS